MECMTIYDMYQRSSCLLQAWAIHKLRPPAGCGDHGPCEHGMCVRSENGSEFCLCDSGWDGQSCDNQIGVF